MKSMHQKLFVVAALGCAFARGSTAFADSINQYIVTLNTAPLQTSDAGPFSLDFQLQGSGGNAVTVDQINFGGGAGLVPAMTFGDASGDISSSVTLDTLPMAGGYSELYEAFVPGNILSFRLTTTVNLTANPDGFVS